MFICPVFASQSSVIIGEYRNSICTSENVMRVFDIDSIIKLFHKAVSDKFHLFSDKRSFYAPLAILENSMARFFSSLSSFSQ